MNSLGTSFYGAAGFAIAVLGWYLFAFSGIFSQILVPEPHLAFQALYSMVSTGAILPDLALTLYRTGVSYGFAALIGIPAGLILGYSRIAYQIFQPVVDFFRSIPATALFPLFILLFGLGDASVFAVVVFGNAFIIVLNAMYGVHNASKSRILLAKTMRATQVQIFRKIVFYEALPYVFVGLRQALSIALVIVIVTEMFFGSATGLGYRIFNFHLLYKTPEMYAVIIIAGIVGYLLNLGFIAFERKVVHWVGR